MAAALELIADPAFVVDARGDIRDHNIPFSVEPVAAWRDARRCCEVLGCGRPGASWQGCLTREVLRGSQLATTATGRLPDGRVLRVSAMRLASDDVVYRLRAGTAPAKRTATAEKEPGAALMIRSLGAMHVRRPDLRLDDSWLDQRPGMLLKYLVAARDRAVSADEIAEALWPRLGPSAAGTVRHAVHLLRRHLEPERPPGAPSRFITTRGGRYAVSLDAVWIDADVFESATRTGVDAFVAGRPEAAESSLQQALDLYRGGFLEDEPYADWALDERERLRSMVQVPLRVLAELHLVRGDLDGASVYVERLARLEPLDEDVHRLLIALWLRLRRMSRALRHYEMFKARLRRQLGAVPGFDIEQLMRSDDPLHAV